MADKVNSSRTDATPIAVAPPTRQQHLRRWSVLLGLAVLVLMGFTIRDYGITVDEPRYIENNERMLKWFTDLSRVGWSENLSKDRLHEGWYFARSDSKNLPLVSIVSIIGDITIGRFDTHPASYRWGNALIFAITCGVLFHWIARELSTSAALVSIAALVGTPRLFANANLLSIDPLVASFWVLSSWALWRSRNSWRWSFAFAASCGIGMTSKPTFWFAIPVFIAWGLMFRPRELWRAALLLPTVGPAVTFALVPLWWIAPISGPMEYLDLLRNDPVGWQIDAYYQGEIYQAEGYPALPWHAIVVLSSITTPVWVMLLGFCGAWQGMRRPAERELATLWLLSAVALPVVCMLPGTPAHDGVRLYRTAFYFLAPLAGLGVHRLLQTRSLPLQTVTAFAAVALAVWEIGARHPAELSAYNALVGGLPGAAELRDSPPTLPETRRPQYEVTYWWDLLTPDAVTDMQSHIPVGSRLWVFPEHAGMALLQEWGYIRDDIELVSHPQDADLVLLYGRMGRLLDPRAAPLGNRFLYGDPVWEQRVDGVRTVALLKW